MDRSGQKSQQGNVGLEPYFKTNGPDITFHPTAAEHAFPSSAHRTFPMTDNMWGHKAILSKFRKAEIILNILQLYGQFWGIYSMGTIDNTACYTWKSLREIFSVLTVKKEMVIMWGDGSVNQVLC